MGSFLRKKPPRDTHARSLRPGVQPRHFLPYLLSLLIAKARLTLELHSLCRPDAQPTMTPRSLPERLAEITTTKKNAFALGSPLKRLGYKCRRLDRHVFPVVDQKYTWTRTNNKAQERIMHRCSPTSSNTGIKIALCGQDGEYTSSKTSCAESRTTALNRDATSSCTQTSNPNVIVPLAFCFSCFLAFASFMCLVAFPHSQPQTLSRWRALPTYTGPFCNFGGAAVL